MDTENILTGEHELRFALVVTIPNHQARQFVRALTGDDDDIILAAETTMREFHPELEEIELTLSASEQRVKAELHRAARHYERSNQ